MIKQILSTVFFGTMMSLGCGESAKPVSLAQGPLSFGAVIIEDTHLRNIKRSVAVILDGRVSKADLRSIATQIKNSDPGDYERTFISYRLRGMESNQLYWATSNYTPKLDIHIIGLPLKEETLNARVSHPDGSQLIGMWHFDLVKGWTVTIFKRDEHLLIRIIESGDVFSEHTLIEDAIAGGRRKFIYGDPGPDRGLYDGDQVVYLLNLNGILEHRVDGELFARGQPVKYDIPFQANSWIPAEPTEADKRMVNELRLEIRAMVKRGSEMESYRDNFQCMETMRKLQPEAEQLRERISALPTRYAIRLAGAAWLWKCVSCMENALEGCKDALEDLDFTLD